RAERAGCMDVAIGKTAGAVQHHAIPGVTDAAANRAEPVAASGERHEADGAAAFDARPLNVGLDAEHGLTGLPVVTELAAEDAARRVDIVRRTPAAAAVDAGVEAGPVVIL